MPHDEILCFSKLISWTSRFDQECSDSCQCDDENHVTLNGLHNGFKTSVIEIALKPEISIADESTLIIAIGQVKNPTSFSLI